MTTHDNNAQNCPRCREVRDGLADRRCAFRGDGTFYTDNWNCETLNTLRRLGEARRVYGSDESATLLSCEPDIDGGFIALNWYKNRGRTTWAVWLRDDGEWMPAPVPLAVAERTIAWAEKLATITRITIPR